MSNDTKDSLCVMNNIICPFCYVKLHALMQRQPYNCVLGMCERKQDVYVWLLAIDLGFLLCVEEGHNIA